MLRACYPDLSQALFAIVYLSLIPYLYNYHRRDSHQGNIKMAEVEDKGITKTAAVKKALKELGKDAMPVKIQEYVMERFGLEMTTSHVSNYKSMLLKKKKRMKATAVESEKPLPHPRRLFLMKAPSPPAAGPALSVEDIKAVKDLVGRMGEEHLKSLIKVLG